MPPTTPGSPILPPRHHDARPPTQRCGDPSKLQCPKCVEQGLPKAPYCSQECFKAAWPDHKKAHKSPNDGWAFCTRRGRARAAAMPYFDWTGPLRPFKIGPTRAVPGAIDRPDYAADGNPRSRSRAGSSATVRRGFGEGGVGAALLLSDGEANGSV